MTAPLPVPPSSPFSPPPDELKWVECAKETVSRFSPPCAALEDAARLPLENLRLLHEAGLDTALLPVAKGGGGISMRTFGKLVGLVARRCPCTACVWLMHVGAGTMLVALSPPDVSEFFAQALKSGRRFAIALSETGPGEASQGPISPAIAVEGGWRFDGAKRFVSGCELADYFLVNASLDGAPTFFGVDRDDTLGFTDIWDTMGMRATRSQLISFNGTVLRADRRCRRFEVSDPYPTGLGLPWLSIGLAETIFEELRKLATVRKVSGTGKLLGEMQWVQFEVAEAHVALQASRLLAERALWLSDAGSPESVFALLEAKLHANQVAKQIADLALRAGGASCYLKSSPIERHFRNAQAGALMSYSVEACRDMIGKQVLAPPKAPENG